MKLKSARALLLCALAASAGAAGPVPNTSTLADALISSGPHPALGTRMNLYGQFVGAWDVQVTNYPRGEQPTHGRGEWTFGWVLEGRAIQDVWNVPPRSERDPKALAAGPYGTTIRFPEPDGNTWRITWIHPVRNDVTLMKARAVGTEIIQDVIGEEEDATRWVFYDISSDRFRWRAEERDGQGWRRLQEMIVTRKPRVAQN